ncbi:putative subunit of adaptor complex [Hamiltosporidium magnivora]|uniref:Putative subunit of adaptor complex n=1 Tax=Hamiltosporidium magnivora TaxID=148818 RepID=A0A4Q9L0E0_9MICR|nr:putative subunit of adaptor complex [Hamiltosporidium magnivora]
MYQDICIVDKNDILIYGVRRIENPTKVIYHDDIKIYISSKCHSIIQNYLANEFIETLAGVIGNLNSKTLKSHFFDLLTLKSEINTNNLLENIKNNIDRKIETVKKFTNNESEIMLDVIEELNVIMDIKGNILRNNLNGKISAPKSKKTKNYFYINLSVPQNLEFINLEDNIDTNIEKMGITENCFGNEIKEYGNNCYDLESKNGSEDKKPVLDPILNNMVHLKQNTYLNANKIFSESKFQTPITLKCSDQCLIRYKSIPPKPPIQLTLEKNYILLSCRMKEINNINIKILLPYNSHSVSSSSENGKATFFEKDSIIIWNVTNIKNESAKLILNYQSFQNQKLRGILIDFECLFFSCTGLTIKDVGLKEKTAIWAKYLFKSGRYEIRI